MILKSEKADVYGKIESGFSLRGGQICKIGYEG